MTETITQTQFLHKLCDALNNSSRENLWFVCGNTTIYGLRTYTLCDVMRAILDKDVTAFERLTWKAAYFEQTVDGYLDLAFSGSHAENEIVKSVSARSPALVPD